MATTRASADLDGVRTTSPGGVVAITSRRRLIAAGLGLFMVTGVLMAAPGQAASGSREVQAVASLINGGSNNSTYAVIKTISVGLGPLGVAVDNDDDTVYVVNEIGDSLSVITGSTGVPGPQRGVGDRPWGVAVDQQDDTVYVANQDSDSVSIFSGRSVLVSATVPVGSKPVSLAINDDDDSVYVANFASTQVSVLDGRTGTRTDDTITVGLQPSAIAVNQEDDTVYVTNWGTHSLSIINGRTGLADDTISVGFRPSGVAVNQEDDTVYVANESSNDLSIIDGRTGLADDTVPIGAGPWGVAVNQEDGTVYVTMSDGDSVSVINGRDTDDSVSVAVGDAPLAVAVDDSGTNQGLVYVSNYLSDNVSVVARVTPTASPVSGSVGTEVTIAVDVPHIADGYTFDDSTVSAVTFDGAAGTGLTRGAGNTWTVTVPAGTGTVPVQVTFNGGLTARAGDFSYPAPPPPSPPSAPTSVSGIAGDASAQISWQVPATSGSFTVTNYQAVVAPSGQSCLVSAPLLTCSITGLSNGTAYTATVRALNGAGWGPYSAASAPFTPSAPEPPAPTVPGPVRDLDVVRATARGVLVLRWLPPEDGLAVKYRAAIRRAGDFGYSRIRPAVTTTSIRITGLTPGARYRVRVQAGNDAGWGTGVRYPDGIRIPSRR